MDILVIALMCLLNAKQAKAKNRRPLMFVIITIVLMFGLSVLLSSIVLAVQSPELLNAASSDNLLDMYSSIAQTILIPAFGGLILGGIISFLIVKFSKPGDPAEFQNQYGPYGQNPYNQYGQNPYGQNPYGQNPYGQNPYGQNSYGQGNPYTGQAYGQNPYTGGQYGQNPYTQNAYGQAPYNPYTNPNGSYMNQQNACGQTWEEAEDEEYLGKLSVPCTLHLVRENAQSGASELYTFSLNGHTICRLGNGSEANIQIRTVDNTITARSGTGMSLKKPVHFQAVDGGIVEVFVKGDQFLPEKTVGRKPAGSEMPS